jgi:hypothetical protein
MKPTSRLFAWAVAALVGLAAPAVEASSAGIFDVAKPAVGCWCHGGALPANSTTQAVILGLPTAQGYIGGRVYSLTVFVLGTAVPAPAFAGFNLAATEGSFAETAQVRVRNKTQCQELRDLDQCLPGSPFDPCLFCDDETRANATHTLVGPLGPAAGRYVWQVDWRAPPPTTGDVTFYLAGNVVNGLLANDPGDVWSVMSPLTLQETY